MYTLISIHGAVSVYVCMHVCIVYALTPGLFIHACKYFNVKYLYVCVYVCIGVYVAIICVLVHLLLKFLYVY